MLSKSTIKLIKSLALKKYRKQENLFLVEGDKLVLEVIHSHLKIKELIITPEFENINKTDTKNIEKITRVDFNDLKKCSLLKTPQGSIAVCRIPSQKAMPAELNKSLSLYLDGIQDPGNMGTIIRICDWFGIEHVFCSPDTVDLYNPKVIQASMGSFKRISLWRCEFDTLKLLAEQSGTTIFGAFMDGQNIYTTQLPHNALLVMGNEGNGIRPDVEGLIDKKISIPNFSSNTNKAESLNVSVATAIICSEFKRNF